jgi:hypothetical protein
MTRVAVIAKNNGYGLSIDSDLVQQAVAATGCNVVSREPQARGLLSRLFRKQEFDIVIHLERVFPNWVSAGKKNWLIPNQERFPKRHISRLRHIDLVLAKTHHAKTVFSGLGCKTVFTGFTSRDRLMPQVEKNWNRFFHLAGGSTLKGTEDILVLWSRHPEWPELVLVQKKQNATKAVPANVTLLSGHICDTELQRLQNECGIHLCPSRSEGWGHHLHEAMSCGAVVLTTDAPPMNEFITASNGVLVPFCRQEPRHLGFNFYVDQGMLEQQVALTMKESEAERLEKSKNARTAFLENSDIFKNNWPQQLAFEII